MTNEQYKLHQAADARAMLALSRENSQPEPEPEPVPTEEELLRMDLAERQEHRQQRINRRLGLPIPTEVKERQNWHKHVSTLAHIHDQIAPKLHALRVARRMCYQELFAIPVRQR